MRCTLSIAAIFMLGSLSAPAQLPKQMQLHDGATKTGDGFYIHITAQSGTSMQSRPKEWPASIIWFTFKIPHMLGDDTAHNCVVHIRDRRGQDLAVLRVTPFKTDKAHKEDAFDIIVVPDLAKKMQLHIDYTGLDQWKSRIITRQYDLNLRDYMSHVK